MFGQPQATNSLRPAMRVVLAVTLALCSVVASAAIITGQVYTREVIRDDNGNRTWVEYDPSTGEELRIVDPGEQAFPGNAWRVMNADEYRDYRQSFQALAEDITDLADPIPRGGYQAIREGDGLLLADGATRVTPPPLGTGTAYVVLLPQNRRLQDDPASLVLGEYPFNPSENHGVSGDTLSMLVNTDTDSEDMGLIAEATPNRLGYQVAFLLDEDGNPVPVGNAGGVLPNSGQDVAGPVEGVPMDGWPYGMGISDSDGRYSITTVNDLFCPVPMNFTYPVTARFQYRRFNPKEDNAGSGAYYQFRTGYGYCYPLYANAGFMGPISLGTAQNTSVIDLDFPIDVTAISGRAQFARVAAVSGDKVELTPTTGTIQPEGGETQYEAQDPDNQKRITDGYDFDNDGNEDTVRFGHLESDPDGNEVFVEDATVNANLDQVQGVWLSSSGHTPAQDPPDITRILDSHSFSSFENDGLLKKISIEDVRNTDVYVVRLSDGRLIAERIGLHEEEAGSSNDFGGNQQQNSFHFSLIIRGSRGDFAHPLRSSFEALQSEAGINPDLHQRQSDHLKPGDRVRIYAINRATGYIGSVETDVQAADDNADLSFHIDPILMGPPNLRVWAERNYEIEDGIQAGDIREDQIIGFEGASLSSDQFVAIHTEWLDHDGRAIPLALEGAGYTGRLAVLSGDKTLPNGADGVYQFEVNPGRNLQVLQIGADTPLENRHYYVHLSGEPSSGNPIFAGTENKRIGLPDFESSGANPGILSNRPDHYVPFLVPLFDEAGTELQRRALRRLRDQGLVDNELNPGPMYRWAYRPELQFTNYNLDIEELKTGPDHDGDGDIDPDQLVDLLGGEGHTINPDDLLSIFYSLGGPDLEALDYFNAGEEKTLVFSLAGQELEARLTENGRLVFDDNQFLDSLSPDDFITLSLYANNDAGNPLWEYAFARLSVYVDANHDRKINTANIDLNGMDLSNPSSLTAEQIENLKNTDKTSPARPFRFWINNDYDVVVKGPTSWDYWLPFIPIGGHESFVKLEYKTCPEVITDENDNDQDCTEEDMVVGQGNARLTNSDEAHRENIESFRDLEDFAPLVIHLDSASYEKVKTGDYEVHIEAHGIGVNLFQGTWQEDGAVEQQPACSNMPEQDGAGEDILRHLNDCVAAFRQTADGLHLFYVNGKNASGGESIGRLPPGRIEALFYEQAGADSDGSLNDLGYKANILFEGVDASDENCQPDDSADCYLEVRLIEPGKNKIISRQRVYVDLQPIKTFYDHYTAGTWIECKDSMRAENGECEHQPSNVATLDLYQSARDVHAGEAEPASLFHNDIPQLEGARYRQEWIDSYPYRSPVPTFLNREDSEVPYFILVHGWRMPYAARVSFSETTYKRLYWKGYSGRFGTFTWPTGWFRKDPNLNSLTTLAQVFRDLNNYSRSERIARDSGPVLAGKLLELKARYASVHLMAHSMGNVVASEALLASDTVVLDTYVATQAATAAGAYAANAQGAAMHVNTIGQRDIKAIKNGETSSDQDTRSFWGDAIGWVGDIVDSGLEEVCTPFNRMDFENTWRCVNIDNGEWDIFNHWYDIPPDWYQKAHSAPRQHPDSISDRPYYFNIRTKVRNDRIINFFNEVDSALDGWNLQQVTKPDLGGWNYDAVVLNEEECEQDQSSCQIQDLFSSPIAEVVYGEPDSYDLHWGQPSHRRIIMSFIIPSRTYAFGATANLARQGEINDDFNLRSNGIEYTNSDYHHSAQFLDSYTERSMYWREVYDTINQ